MSDINLSISTGTNVLTQAVGSDEVNLALSSTTNVHTTAIQTENSISIDLVGSVTPTSLLGLTDVNASSITNNQLLQFDSTSGTFLNSDISLDELSDVAITSVSNNQVLAYNATSGNFVNVSLDSDSFNIDASQIAVNLGSGLAGRLVTVNSDGTLNAETAGLFDPGGANDLHLISTDQGEPSILLDNNNSASANPSFIKFKKDKGAAGADGDDIGKIDFVSDDAGQNQTTFVQILGEVAVAADGQEGGKLTLSVASHDAEIQPGLIISDGDAEDEVDVILGNGSASLTTVAGTLTMGSTAAMTNAGQLSVAAQPNITTMTGFLGGTANALITDDGDGTVTSEANAIYGNDSLALSSSVSGKPTLELINSNTDADSSELIFQKTATGADNDYIGGIQFDGKNDTDSGNINFAKIFTQIADASDTDEAGKLTIQVATSNGTVSNLRNVLFAEGSPSADDVDVTLGHGSTSITTVAGNLNVNGTDHAFTSSTDNKPVVTLSNGGTAQVGAQLTFKRTATGADNTDIGTIHFEGKNDADEDITYAKINVDTADASDGAEEGQMLLLVASHDGELQPGLNIISGNLEDEVDATIGNGANSLVTVPGKLSIGTRIDFDSTGITGIQTAAELSSPGFQDNDTSLLTAAAIDDRINAASGGVTADPFSTTVIKILPNQFMPNDDVGRPAMIEDDGTNILGVKAALSTDELYAFQKLPSGYKATHVQVHASQSTSNAVEAFSYNYQTGADNAVSSTQGDLNANIDITDIPSSATQDLVIKVTPASSSTVMFGATVTIATI